MTRAGIITISVLLGLAVAMALGLYVEPDQLVAVYQARLQTPLFSGFLTIGAFLLSLMTFILMKLKEDVYDSEAYRKRHRQLVEGAGHRLDRYAPLRNLSTFLVGSVLMALATAVLQLTIGLVRNHWASAFCIAAAIATAALVFLLWSEIRRNFTEWFDILGKPMS